MAKRRQQHGHHGGAWKVAYADFVTAMMALFMVLWIVSQSEEVVEATAAYFQNPMGVLSLNSKKSIDSGEEKGNDKSKKNKPEEGDNFVELEYLKTLASQFYKDLQVDPSDTDRPVDIIVTDNGLRIIIYDRKKQPLFITKTSYFTDWGSFIMQNLAWIIERYPLRVMIESHLAGNADLSKDYGAWDLTTDRANAARKTLVSYALSSEKIACVSGYGDSKYRFTSPLEIDKNQRLELSLLLKTLLKTHP
jgi:chemotaxis protein MotB